MVNDEISFIYYLKNYAFTLEDFLRRGKEEFFKGVYCDSIKMPDSLKFETMKTHRTVYGGGGIMPDFFVPLDTTATFVPSCMHWPLPIAIC